MYRMSACNMGKYVTVIYIPLMIKKFKSIIELFGKKYLLSKIPLKAGTYRQERSQLVEIADQGSFHSVSQIFFLIKCDVDK